MTRGPCSRNLLLLFLTAVGAVALAGTLAAQDAATTPRRGEAPAVAIDYLNPREFFLRGGYLMWPILGCSIITITFGFERFISLRRGRIIPLRFLRRFHQRLNAGELDQQSALEMCRANRSPMAEILLACVRRWGRPVIEIEQAINDTGEREVGRLRRNLRAIQASGNIATLLGLLGTIFGMVDAFNQLAVYEGGSRSAVLAGGIAQALLTTAFGLTVAIPSSALYNYFCGKVERLVYDMNLIADSFVDAVGAGELTLRTPTPLDQKITLSAGMPARQSARG